MNRVYPLVSIIVRTKDRPILLKKALKSIASQTYRTLEVVLINDGGCDLDVEELKSILGDIRVQYTKLDKNTGRAHAGNAGIESAQGDYIGFLDDDDEYYPDHIVTLVNILETYDYKAAYTDAYISFFDFDPEEKEFIQKEKRLFMSRDFSLQELLIDNYIPLLSLLFRSDVLRDHKGFDEKFDIYEDWDLLIRIADKYPFYHAGKVTAEYIQWSNHLQISQSPLFFEKTAAYHNQIIIKHKNKYTPEIIRSLVQSRRMLRDKDARITTLEHAIWDTEDQDKGMHERISGLEKTLQGKEDELDEHLQKIRDIEKTIRGKDDRIECLDNAIGDQAKQITELKNTIQNRDFEILDLRKSVREKDGSIDELEEKVRKKACDIVNLEEIKQHLKAAYQEKEAALNRILHSHGWKGLLLYYKTRDRIFPPFTRRRTLLKSFVRKISGLLKAPKKKGRTDNRRLPGGPIPPDGVCAGKGENLHTGNVSGKATQYGEMSGWSLQDKPSGDNPVDVKQKSVLVAGIYLANQENGIVEIVQQLKQSKKYHIVQKWIALHGDAPSPEVDSVTIAKLENPLPKFILLNKILAAEKFDRYHYIILCDDDIHLGQAFLDNFLELQQKYDFALAQPARTHNSYIDHPFVEQFEGLKARRTRFIEIGPVVSIRKDAFPLLLPFDESSCMGWGYDFVWPYLIEQGGLRMGIIDATPIAHSMRKPVKNYVYEDANSSMREYLSNNPHLTKEEAFCILESYA
jgi:glycosyltransferase involved in cell wall biosynthesis